MESQNKSKGIGPMEVGIKAARNRQVWSFKCAEYDDMSKICRNIMNKHQGAFGKTPLNPALGSWQ
jgi:hypothetical protein